MKYRAHLTGGAAAGTVALLLTAGSGALSAPPASLTEFTAHPGVALGGGVFLTAWLMALFPDLDTRSIPQKWYLRCVALGTIGALLADRGDWVAVIALAALLPLLHKHRGWTHWKLTPWVLALLAALLAEYSRTQSLWFSGFSWRGVSDLLAQHWMFVMATVLGHSTHLLLDSRMPGRRPRLRKQPVG